MRYESKTKAALIKELKSLQKKVHSLEKGNQGHNGKTEIAYKSGLSRKQKTKSEFITELKSSKVKIKSKNIDSRFLNALEQLKVHDHLCLIYETKEEQFATVIPFIRIGLERGEKCVYIVDDNTAALVINAMRKEGIDVDKAIKKEALAIITKKEAYLKQGYFDPDLMIAFLKKTTEEAKASGFSALRATGEMTWMLGGEPGVERIIEYESKLNYFFPVSDALAICQYNKKRFAPEIIRDVISTHPLIVFGKTVCKNFYYVPPDEFLAPLKRRTYSEVDRLLKNILEREKAESSLEESVAQLCEAQRLAHIGNWELDLEKNILYWSDEIYRLFEIDPKKFGASYEAFLEAIHPDDRKFVDTAYTTSVKNKTPYSIDHRLLFHDGRIKFVHEECKTFYDKKGNPIRSTGTVQDITERKRTEAINASRAHLVEFSLTHSLDELLEETINETEKLTGSCIGFYHFVDDDQKSLTLQNWSTRTKTEFCNAEGKGLHYSIDEAGVWVDCVHQRKTVVHNDYASLPNRRGMPKGHATVIRELVVPVFRGAKISAILGVGNKSTNYTETDVEAVTQIADLAWDIADRKRAEEALHASEEKFLKAFRLSPVALTLAGLDDGILVEANDAFEQLTGYKLAEVLGKTSRDIELFPIPGEREKFIEMLKTTGQVRSAELYSRHKSGALRIVRCSAETILIRGKQYILTTTEDITDRKQQEQAIASLNRVYKVLSETNQLIIREKDPKLLLQELCRIAVEDGKLSMASVSFVDDKTKKVIPFVWFGKEDGYFSSIAISVKDEPEGRGPTGRALKENRYVFSTDIASEPTMQPWREQALKRGYRSSAAFPLVINEIAIGAFTVYADEPNFFNEHELSLLNELAMDLSYALQNLEIEKSRKLALDALLESEEKFRQLASSAQDSIVMMDEKGKFFYWNKSFEKLFGYTSEEIEGKEVHSTIVPPRYYPDYVKGFAKYTETGEGSAIGKTTELYAVKKDGKEFPVELSVSTFMFKGERMALAILRDITERKRAQEEMVRINEWLETIFSNTHMMFAYLDEKFNFIRVNRAYAEADGRNPEFFPGKNHFELFPYEENQKIFQSVVDSGEPVSFYSKPFEYAEHPERGVSYWDWTLQPIKDSNGKVANLLFSLLNVTERVLAEKELQTSNEQLKQVFDNIEAVVFSLDLAKGKLLKISKACEKVYGIEQEEFFKNPKVWMTLVHPEDLHFVQANWQSLLTHEKESSEVEYRIIRQDGEMRWIRNETKSIADENGNAIRMDGISYDITEKKKAEVERLFHFMFMENLDKVTRAIHKTNDLNQMMNDVLKTVFSIFDCDRIWLFYPCDPDAPSFHVRMEITKPEYPGAKVLNVEIPMPQDMSQNLREALESPDPLTYTIGTEKPINKVSAEQFGVKSMMMTALYPKSGKPWAFGMHQCSTPRIWTEEEIKLFKEISNRISEGLSSMLFLRDLQESEERFRRLAENARDVIYRMSLPDGKYEYISPAVLSLFGYSPEEFYNTPTLFKQLIHPNWQKYFEDQWINLVKGNMPPTYEYQIIHKSGEVRWLNQRNILVHDNAGSPIAIEGIVTDITERKLTENELRKLSEAVEQSPVSVVIADLDANIEYVNKTFEETTGYTFEEVVHQNPKIIQSGLTPKETYKDFWNTITSGQTWKGEFLNKKKNGELFWENEIITPIFDKNNRIINYLAIKQDVTEKKKMTEELIVAKDRAEKSDKLKTEFLQQMSHEIRSPMNVAISLSNLIKDEVSDKVSPEVLEYFEGIDLAGKRLIRTVDLILNTSEMYVGTYEPTLTEIDIGKDILKHIKSEFGNIAGKKGLEFILSCNVSKPIVHCDRYSVVQIFSNLVDNAIKYTQRGKVEISVDMNSSHNITVAVEDTGIGISEEFMNKLFEPFTQEERGYSRRFEGNGLGLALVKKYCDMNKATIEVQSTKGKGSKFTVTFIKK